MRVRHRSRVINARHVKKRRAATKLQKVYRGHRARKAWVAKRNGAVALESAIRGYQLRKRFEAMKNMGAAEAKAAMEAEAAARAAAEAADNASNAEALKAVKAAKKDDDEEDDDEDALAAKKERQAAKAEEATTMEDLDSMNTEDFMKALDDKDPTARLLKGLREKCARRLKVCQPLAASALGLATSWRAQLLGGYWAVLSGLLRESAVPAAARRQPSDAPCRSRGT